LSLSRAVPAEADEELIDAALVVNTLRATKIENAIRNFSRIVPTGDLDQGFLLCDAFLGFVDLVTDDGE
jgi:hypothetical protein